MTFLLQKLYFARMITFFNQRKPAKGLETKKMPRGKRKSMLLTTKMLRFREYVTNERNHYPLSQDMFVIRGNAGKPQCELESSAPRGKSDLSFQVVIQNSGNANIFIRGHTTSLCLDLQPVLLSLTFNS